MTVAKLPLDVANLSHQEERIKNVERIRNPHVGIVHPHVGIVRFVKGVDVGIVRCMV